jgi:hypothetical protein
MDGYDLTGPGTTNSADQRPCATSGAPVTASSGRGPAPPLLPGVRRLVPDRTTGSVAVAALMCVVIGLSGCAGSSPSASGPSATASTGHGAPPSGIAAGPGSSGGSNARSGPAAGGAVGTVSSVSASGFTLSTSAGQNVTVNGAPSTTYQKGASSASASAVTSGEPVLVLGTTSGTTITATQVVVQPAGGASASSSAAQVVPFQRGAPSTSKQVGQIPPNYTEGSGTIVSGTTANKATEAALAVYPGGVVDRVVQLSGGEYEAHYIGVNWPHHIFVDQGFKVVGAN